VGFSYKWVESAQQFSHPAVIMLLTPDGRVSRYLYGVSFDQKLLRLSLVETGAGKVGSVMDKILLLCFHFDPAKGTYSLAAMRVMQMAGVGSVLLLGGFVGTMAWIRSRKYAVAGAKPARGLAAVMARDQATPPVSGFEVGSAPKDPGGGSIRDETKT
jgi:protein SCO1/2